jgi:hypothetical protein
MANQPRWKHARQHEQKSGIRSYDHFGRGTLHAQTAYDLSYHDHGIPSQAQRQINRQFTISLIVFLNRVGQQHNESSSTVSTKVSLDIRTFTVFGFCRILQRVPLLRYHVPHRMDQRCTVKRWIDGAYLNLETRQDFGAQNVRKSVGRMFRGRIRRHANRALRDETGHAGNIQDPRVRVDAGYRLLLQNG